jgi:protein-L-isoaspartate(D-aspartate) O-methyltransferase
MMGGTPGTDFTMTDEYSMARRRMIEELRSQKGIMDERVLTAMDSVPRHVFVPEALKFQAYRNNALPIDGNQTISQPYIVARMSELLEPGERSKILEIGTGSGYQTAILAALGGKIYSIERVHKLAAKAEEVLRELGLRNVTVKHGDGTKGWEAYEPYDGILVAAGSPAAPEPLIAQLKTGGRLVIPVGADMKEQELIRFTKTEGGIKRENFGKCSFVPLIGEHGWQE